MRTVRIFLSAAAVLMPVVSCMVPVSTTPPTPESIPPVRSAYGATESQIFDLINRERRRRGLKALVFNEQLDRMAKIQAQNMAHFQRMAHVLPESKLPTLGDRARFVGYPFNRLAENVALGYPSAESVVEGWMNSRGHRENILNGAVAETGIGIMKSRDGGIYFCQVFGRQMTTF